MNLKYGRTLIGLTQEQVAELVDVDRSLIGAIERGASGTSMDSLATLGEAIGVPAHVLIMPPTEAHPIILAAVEKVVLRETVDVPTRRKKQKLL